MALAIEWQSNVEIEIDKMKQELLNKAERLDVEQISRQQDEKINKLSLLVPESSAITAIKTEIGPERVCYECVEAGDLNTAFSTILRYIDSTAQTKAEKKEVSGKATQTYADALFDRLSVITHQQIREMTEGLQNALESRIDNLMDQFNAISKSINDRMDKSDYEIYSLSQAVSNYSNLYKKRQPRYKNQNKEDLQLNKTHQFNFRTELTPRRQTLKRSFDMSKKQMISSFKTSSDPNKVPLSITKMKKQRNKSPK